MKFLLAIVFISHLSLSYANTWEQLLLKVEITDTNEVTSHAFIRIVSDSFNRDSLISTGYLLSLFDLNDEKVDETITFYSDKINYKRRYKKSNHDSELFKIVEPYELGLNSIRKINVIEISDDNFALRIESEHMKKDEQWMNKEATNLLVLNHYNTLFSYYFYSYSDGILIDELRCKFEALDVSKSSDRKEFDRLIRETTRTASESQLVVLSYCSLNF